MCATHDVCVLCHGCLLPLRSTPGTSMVPAQLLGEPASRSSFGEDCVASEPDSPFAVSSFGCCHTHGILRPRLQLKMMTSKRMLVCSTAKRRVCSLSWTENL